MEIPEQVKGKAMANIDKTQELLKKNYDARQQPLVFKEGDIAMLNNMRNYARKGGKLGNSWSGPRILSAASDRKECTSSKTKKERC